MILPDAVKPFDQTFVSFTVVAHVASRVVIHVVTRHVAKNVCRAVHVKHVVTGGVGGVVFF